MTESNNNNDKKIIDLHNNKITGGDKSSDIEEIYLNKCNELINSHFKEIKTEYKGFVDKDNSIYAIFEKKDESKINIGSGSKMVIIDEIVNKKKVSDTPIQDGITEVFNENSHLLKMNNENGDELENPIIAYLCKKNGAVYENVYEDEKQEDNMDLQVHHDTFGDVYLFTIEPINNVGSFFSFFTGTKQVKRYALFLENETAIENNDKNVVEFIKEQGMDVPENTCISFKESGRQFWAVKSRELFTEI